MTLQNEKSARRRCKAARSRALVVLAGVVLFAGLFMQITMLSRIAAKSKAASRLEGEIEELNASRENLELNINQYHNLDAIAVRARQLGLGQPTETQIRVVSVARSDAGNTSTQAAGNFGAESFQN